MGQTLCVRQGIVNNGIVKPCVLKGREALLRQTAVIFVAVEMKEGALSAT